LKGFLKFRASVLPLLLICVLLLSACGGGESKDPSKDPSSLLSDQSKQYRKGEEEIDYIIPEDPRSVLTDRIKEYVASRENPEPMDDEQAQDAFEKAEEDEILDTSGQNEIGSDDDLQKILAWMMDETKTVATVKFINGYTFDVKHYLKILDRAMRADPIDGICVKYYGRSSDNLILEYSIPTSTLIQMKKDTRELVKQALKDLNLSGRSQIEIVQAVNDYLCDHNTYPDEDFEKYPGWFEGYAPESHTAYGLFKLHSAVCDGYARSCKVLLDELGVECIIITGKGDGENHAWNMIKINGAWYHTDVCWNDSSWTRQDYLLISDKDISTSHTWDQTEYPASAAQSYTF
jgi:hypothetical protein